MTSRLLRRWAPLLACVLWLSAARAEEAPATEPVSPSQAAWNEASQAMQRGPSQVALLSEARIALPEGFGFVPKPQAAKLMETMGNSTGEGFLGLIFPLAEEQTWFMSVDYTHEGHVSDEDAKDWNAEDLLDNLKEGTKQGNKRREGLGIKPIEVTGWVEKPAYDAANHRLVWSVGLKDIGAPAGDDDGVNYNTYVLGREGYIEMNLITALKTVEAEKPVAHQLLAATTFNEGRRYADFKPSTDKVAAYGLAALVGGVALKKLGVLAVAGAFFAKFAKLIIVAVGGLFYGLRKTFGGGNKA